MGKQGSVSLLDLDGVASSPPERSVVEAMLPWLLERHASSDSLSARGAAARRAIEEARSEVAALVGATPEEVVFTSGATEANNLALKGAAALLRERVPVPLITIPAHEQASLLHPARSLSRAACRLEVLPVGRDGLVDPNAVRARAPALLAFAHAHRELGSLQPAATLTLAARERAGGLVLLDTSLTAGRIPLNRSSLGDPDLLVLSFHNLGGPAGVGALVLRGAIPIPPLIEGGTQERGYRPGSPNLPGIVGAGAAARLSRLEAQRRAEALERLGRRLFRELGGVEGVDCCGPPPGSRLPGHLALIVSGVDGEALALSLEEHGVLAATASPCTTEAGLPSAALRAAGYSSDEARSLLVLCIPPTAIPEEEALVKGLVLVRREIERLRALSWRP